jgi:hypothetical protein
MQSFAYSDIVETIMAIDELVTIAFSKRKSFATDLALVVLSFR